MNNKIVIPFSIEKRRIIIFAIINGFNGKFIWDTGSPISLVNFSLNGLEFYKEDTYHYFGGFSKKHKIFRLNCIQFKKNKLKNSSLIGYTPKYVKKVITYPVKADGILGLNIFVGYWCELSFTENLIILHKKKPNNYINRKKLITDKYGYFISSKINKKIYKLLIDTGSPYSIKIPEENIPKKSVKIQSTSPNYRNGCYYKVVSTFTLLNSHFKNSYITFYESLNDYGIIGIEFLRNFDILFDMSNSIHNADYLYYKKSKNLNDFRSFIIPKNTKKNNIIEYRLYNNGIKLELTKVNKYSKYGITNDTLIVAINGILIKNYNLDDLKKQIANNEINKITVSNGIRKNIFLKNNCA